MARFVLVCALLVLLGPCAGGASKETSAEKASKDDGDDEPADVKESTSEEDEGSDADEDEAAAKEDEDEDEDEGAKEEEEAGAAEEVEEEDADEDAEGDADEGEGESEDKKGASAAEDDEPDEKKAGSGDEESADEDAEEPEEPEAKADADEGGEDDEDKEGEADEADAAAADKDAAAEDKEAGAEDEGGADDKAAEEPEGDADTAGKAGTPDLAETLKSAQEALKAAEKDIATVQDQIADANGGKEAKVEEPKEASGMDFTMAKQVAVPIAAFIIGAILHKNERTAVFGKLAMFFGAQTCMNLYMKEILSGSVVDEENGLHGFPSAFIVTALQQMVAFVLFGIAILVLSCTPYAYTPKKLSTPMEWFAVVLFSFSFTLNIALNNFSMALLPLSVNLIIRSCLPLATFVSQRVASQCTHEPVKDARIIEILLMLLGVACAAVAVVAKSHSKSEDGSSASKTLVFGVIVCIASLFSGAINLALAGVLGTSCKLNSLDSTVYMSVPAFLFLVLPSLFYRHPVGWPGYKNVTDWDILLVVLERKPSVFGLAAFSGVLALFYNVFQYGIVHSLSASYTAFAGNFNKAATIALGLLIGLESLPPGKWGIIMILACLGNIGAFTAFNIVKIQGQNNEASKQREVTDTSNMQEEKKELIEDKP